MKLNFLDSTEKYRSFALPFLVAVIVILLFLNLIQPKISEILVFRQDIDLNKQRLEKLNTKLIALRGTDEEKLKANLIKINTALPSEKDIMGLVTAIERLAGEASISAQTMQLAPGSISTSSAKGTQASSIDVQATFTGNFEAIKTFLSKIEGASRILTVKSLSLMSGAKEEGTLQASIPLVAYYLSLPSSMGDVAEPVPTLNAEDETIYQKISNLQIYSLTPSPTSGGKADPFAKF